MFGHRHDVGDGPVYPTCCLNVGQNNKQVCWAKSKA